MSMVEVRPRGDAAYEEPLIFRPIRRWLEDIPIADPLRRRHAVTLQIFAWAFCLGAITLEAARAVSQRHFSITTAINGLDAFLALLAAYWLRKGRYRPAALLMVVGFGTVLVLATAIGGLQFSRDGVRAFVVVLTLAALLLGRRALWIACFAGVAAITVAAARDFGHLGGLGPHPAPISVTALFVSSAITYLILAIVLDRFGLTIQETLRSQKRAESALRNSEELFRVAFQTTPNSVSISRLDDGVIIAVNEGFTLLTGWPRAEAVGRTSAQLGDRKSVV